MSGNTGTTADTGPDRAAASPPPWANPSRSIPREKVGRTVAQHLVSKLFSGELRGGDRIDLEEIAGDLGVSRAPVREALLQLEHDGVVISHYHRGVFVAPFSPSTVRDHFELYGQLSAYAAQRVTEIGDRDVAQVLEQLNDQVQGARSAPEYEARSRAFLRQIHHGARSPRLIVLLRSFSTFVPESFRTADISPARLARLKKGLAQVMDAMRDGSPEAAHEAMLDNIRYVSQTVVAALAARGVFGEG